MSEIFAKEIGLDNGFLEVISRLRKELGREPRWPEPVTFKEMNMQAPSPILSSALMIAHLEKTDPDYIRMLQRKIRRKSKR
jgi:hypothetical protein